MSQLNYIGSPVPLEVGIYGSTLIPIENIEIIDKDTAIVNGSREVKSGILSFEDKDTDWFKRNLMMFEDGVMAGVHIYSLHGSSKPVKKHFKNKYVYEIQLNTHSKSHGNPTEKRKKELEKDLETLVQLMLDTGQKDGFFEMFSSWTDEEGEPRNRQLDRFYNVVALELIEYLSLEDRQYIRIDC